MGKIMRTPYEMDDPNAISDLINTIKELIKSETKNLKFNRMITAKVIDVDGDFADIQLFEDGVTIPDIKNKTGETLNIGDEVEILLINNSISNSVILIKK
jgi:hypothetical protein